MTREQAIGKIEYLIHTEVKWPGTEDTVEALEMAMAALRKEEAGGWISVADRLPELIGKNAWGEASSFSGLVFVCELYRDGSTHVGLSQYCKTGKWITEIPDETGEPDCKVTHWMPLPSPPEG